MAHIKRIRLLDSWNVRKKEGKYLVRPNAGKNFNFSLSLKTILKEISGLATSYKEVKYLINEVGVYVNNKKRTSQKYPVTLFDVLSFPSKKLYYRFVVDENGRLILKEIDEKESKLRVLKIVSKKQISRKTKDNKKETIFSYGLIDSTTIFGNDVYKVGSSVLFDDANKKVVEEYSAQKGASVLVLSKKHFGSVGVIEEITDKEVLIKFGKDDLIKTTTENLYVLSKTKIKFTI